ncbi:hypothetical protein KHS38_16850 [Mucilaginibacter sp. Bleaf8]|uniref:hypothetical protein n=1 Tax=Mucilaginibacter sp. Bleaf8 TaxID=2834430 RepID=UPI001BCE6996|nr:hypothetical protein [Mucilaginibacter sp. Bleaf8]MBS7566079.1 hypothetical protein [Mucilaginibacter sp. Bleaf8]
MQQKIELAKARDFGEIINDTFMFVKQNFKPLFKIILTFCSFFLLALIVLQYLQQAKILGLQQRMQNDPEAAASFDVPSLFGVEYFLTLIFSYLTQTILLTTVLSYIALYRDKGNIAPSPAEVWGYIKYYFLRIIGSIFVIGILMGLGFVLCIIPGIWLSPILSLIFPIIIFENTSLGYAFNRSFSLIKDNWWATFGALFVMLLIISLGVGILMVPGMIVTAALSLTHLHDASSLFTPLTIIMSVLQTLGFVLAALPIVTLALCYFNLNEKKEGTGLMDRINSFGKQPDTDLPAEEY